MLSGSYDWFVSKKSAFCKILVTRRALRVNSEVNSTRQECPLHTRGILLRGFEQALLSLFLALDAVARPRYSVEPLGVDLFAARDALSEATFADTSQSAIDHVKQLAVIIALAEEEFLIVRTRGTIGGILRGLFVGGAAVLLIADNHVTQFLLPGLEFLFERL